MKFQERLKIALKSSELTQKEIAEKLCISPGNITNWKKGQNLPSIDILYELCIILDESSDFLLGLDDKNNKQETKPQKNKKNTIIYKNSTHNGDNKF